MSLLFTAGFEDKGSKPLKAKVFLVAVQTVYRQAGYEEASYTNYVAIVSRLPEQAEAGAMKWVERVPPPEGFLETAKGIGVSAYVVRELCEVDCIGESCISAGFLS